MSMFFQLNAPRFPQLLPRENSVGNFFQPNKKVSKKEAKPENFFAPIRASVKDFKEKDDNEPAFFKPQKSSKIKKARSTVFRSTTQSTFGDFQPTPSSDFERARTEFQSLPEFRQNRGEFQPQQHHHQQQQDVNKGRGQFQPPADFESALGEFRPSSEQKRAHGEFQHPSDFESGTGEFQPSSDFEKALEQFQPQRNFDRTGGDFQPSSDFERARAEFQHAASDEFESGVGEFRRAASNSIFDNKDNRDVDAADDVNFRPTPTSFENELSDFHSTPPFEPVRANVRPFEPENTRFVAPTPASRFDVTEKNKFTRQARPEHYTERPVDPYSSRPKPADPYKPQFHPRDSEQFNPGSVEDLSPRPFDSFNQGQFNSGQNQHFNPKHVESFSERPEQVSPKAATERSVVKPEAFSTRPATRPASPAPSPKPTDPFENEVESVDGFPSDFEKDPSEVRRPDPFDFHQKIASQFDGSASNEEDQEIVFSGTRRYENDPFVVTDPPTFVDKHIDTMEAPIQAETVEDEPKSRLVHRQRQFSVEEPDTERYAIYDPVRRLVFAITLFTLLFNGRGRLSSQQF